ncbi:hypothetical protein L3X38_009916 [Prunus dulcis]|uniref:Uncharacterized protein n=1 Tax=Prunus dulcis TaxID=3755 RepID=A0AAD4WF90_PRUDU|nr:hypothetical protein L3X38_009916 [Prunus dulcis]
MRKSLRRDQSQDNSQHAATIDLYLACHTPDRLRRSRILVVTHPGIAPASNSLNFGVPTNPKPVSSQKASHYIDARTGSAVAGYCPLWAWLHSHQPARFCFWELTKQLPRVVTHPGIAPASNSLNFGVPTNPKPVSSQKASHYIDARCAI